MKPIIRRTLVLVALSLLAVQPRLAAQTTPLFRILHNFGTEDKDGKPDGYSPECTLAQGRDGNFYGTTPGDGDGDTGGGVVFRITPGGRLTSLYNFKGGKFTYSGVVEGHDGNFYGTTQSVTADEYTVFKITPAGAVTVLYHSGAPIGTSHQGVIVGRDGNLYGVIDNGVGQSGTFFRLTPAGDATVVANLPASNYSQGQATELTQGSDGNFYGVHPDGGAYPRGGGFGLGAIFKVTPEGDYTVLHDFMDTDKDGANPSGALIEGRDGNFYGATIGGTGSVGSAGGTVFRITPAGVLTVLHVFTLGPGEDGYPGAALLQASDGNFYGTTNYTNNGGGVGTVGSIFRMTPAGVVTTLYRFPHARNGAGIEKSALVQGSDGRLYGTATHNGIGYGTVYAYGVTKPVITSPATASGTLGTRFTYQITATDRPTRFAVDGMGGETSVDPKTGLISGVPLGTGVKTLTLHAFNKKGEATQTLTLTIDKEAPVITSPTTASAVEGQPFSYQITADNAPSQFHVVHLPTGLHVDAPTGLISGTSEVLGTFHPTLEAINGKGTGTARLTLTITPD